MLSTLRNLNQVILAEGKQLMISQHKEYNSDSTSRVLAEIAIFVALATALSFIIIFQLPQGGSITLASMVPIIWLALRRGPKIGLTAGFVYGLVQLVVMPQIYFLPQVLLDYPLAFGCLRFSRVLPKKVGITRSCSCHHRTLYHASNFRCTLLCFLRTCRGEPVGIFGNLQRKLSAARTRNKSVCDFSSTEKQSAENVYVKRC